MFGGGYHSAGNSDAALLKTVVATAFEVGVGCGELLYCSSRTSIVVAAEKVSKALEK